MKILSNKQYELFLAQQRKIEQQQKLINKLYKLINKLVNEITKIKEHNSRCDLIYPNTDERGLTGEAETPLNFSDIIEL